MAQTSKVNSSDVVLVISLAYLSADLVCEWEAFEGCVKPVHAWLLVSYGLVLLSRLVYMAGSLVSAQAEDFLLNLRQKSTTTRVMFSLTWLVIVPLSTVWTVVGSRWIYEVLTQSPQCLPDGMHLWFFGIWQIVSYAWILIYCGLGGLAMLLERRLRKAEVDLRSIEDADVVSRWGNVGSLDGYTSLPAMLAGGGLTPMVIQSLPGVYTCEEEESWMCEDCPICLTAPQAGDSVRRLAGCGHTFHRSCVDLWLLRSADCPLCKRKVSSSDAS
jgi:hypothetical protein